MIYYLFVNTYWFPLPSLILGILICLYYKFIKKSSLSIYESLLLIILPSYGWGNLIYNIELKKDIKISLPKKWYIYNYMYKVHIVIVILVLNFFCLISLNYFKNFNYTAGVEYIDVLINNFKAAGHFVIDVINYLFFVIIGLLFIFIPYNIAKSIKINPNIEIK